MEEIMNQAQELIQQAYNCGYKTGRKDGYKDRKDDITIDAKSFIEQGRDEAWRLALRIFRLNQKERKSVFGYDRDTINILESMNASEVLEKIRAYEEEDEIKVGDEVIINKNAISSFVPGTKAIVITIDGCSNCSYNVIVANGDTDWLDKDEIHKTGRNFPEIVEVLKKLKEGE